MTLISKMMTYYSFYVTAFSMGLLLEVLSYSIRDEKVGSWENLHLYHEEPFGSSVWWKSQLEVPFGGVADREWKHLGKKASGI